MGAGTNWLAPIKSQTTMTTLTKESYHTIGNNALSNTKVSTYLKSKELYYLKYVSYEIEDTLTPSMRLGKLVDETVEAGSVSYFKDKYSMAVLKKDDPRTFEILKLVDPELVIPADIYQRVVRISDKILRSPFFKSYDKDTKFQVPILSHKGEFDICGLLDVLTIKDGVAYIDDLKTCTSGAIRDARSWAYHCKNYGYFSQMAVYSALVKENYTDVKEVICRHFAISTSKSDNFPIKLFTVPENLMVGEYDKFIKTCVKISQEQDWIDKLPDWNEAEEIPDVFSLEESGDWSGFEESDQEV